MMQHKLLLAETYPPACGQPTLFAIATPRGLFTGLVHYRPRPSVDQVDVWHPVPRWMLPGEVLRSLES